MCPQWSLPPCSLAVKLDLQLDHEGLYRIKKQTDYYQPEVHTLLVLKRTVTVQIR